MWKIESKKEGEQKGRECCGLEFTLFGHWSELNDTGVLARPEPIDTDDGPLRVQMVVASTVRAAAIDLDHRIYGCVSRGEGSRERGGGGGGGGGM